MFVSHSVEPIHLASDNPLLIHLLSPTHHPRMSCTRKTPKDDGCGIWGISAYLPLCLTSPPSTVPSHSPGSANHSPHHSRREGTVVWFYVFIACCKRWMRGGALVRHKCPPTTATHLHKTGGLGVFRLCL